MIYLLDVVPGLQLLQQKHCLFCLLVSLNFVVDHQWNLWDLLDAVPCRNYTSKFLRHKNTGLSH